MHDADILSKDRELVDEEHALRASVGAGAIDLEEEHQRLQLVEQSLGPMLGPPTTAGSSPRDRSGSQPGNGPQRQ